MASDADKLINRIDDKLRRLSGLVHMAREDGPDIACILEPDGFFRAIDRNNYDVDCDHTGFFSNSPSGYGRTPLDAIIDLIDNTEPVVTFEKYFNPTLPANAGWMAYDNSGNYGFGVTKRDALAHFKRERE